QPDARAPGRSRYVSAAVRIRAASRDDAALLLAMLRELAEYERLSDQLRATEKCLRETLFCEQPVAEALIAERGGEPAGYALFFATYSTFLARPVIWLADLFVRPLHRRFGVVMALLA